jgi:hypothetical protein
MSYKSNKDMLFMLEQSNAKASKSASLQSQPKKFWGKGKTLDSQFPKSAEIKSYICK